MKSVSEILYYDTVSGQFSTTIWLNLWRYQINRRKYFFLLFFWKKNFYEEIGKIHFKMKYDQVWKIVTANQKHTLTSYTSPNDAFRHKRSLYTSIHSTHPYIRINDNSMHAMNPVISFGCWFVVYSICWRWLCVNVLTILFLSHTGWQSQYYIRFSVCICER